MEHKVDDGVRKMEVISLNDDKPSVSPGSPARPPLGASGGRRRGSDVELGLLGGSNGDLSLEETRYEGISQSSGLSLASYSKYDLSGRNLNDSSKRNLYDLSGRNLFPSNGNEANYQTGPTNGLATIGSYNGNLYQARPHSSPHGSVLQNNLPQNINTQVRPHSSPHSGTLENENRNEITRLTPMHQQSPTSSPVKIPRDSPPNSPMSSHYSNASIGSDVNTDNHNVQDSAKVEIEVSPQRSSASEYISPTKSVLSDDTDNTFGYTPSPPFLPKYRKKAIRFSVENEVRTYTPNPEEFWDHPNMSVHLLMPTCGALVRQFLVNSVLPFTYGVTSSLPTLFFLYELVKRSVKNEIIGIYLVAAYICRIIFNSTSRYAPKTFVLIGSFMALGGFVAITLSQNTSFLNIHKRVQIADDDCLAVFVIGSILANCNETVGAMQIFVKDQYSENVKVAGAKLKIQFLVAKFGRVGSFLGGGLLYHYHDLEQVAILGAGFMCLQILVLVCFLVLDNYRISHDPMNALARGDFMKHMPKCRLTCNVRAARGRRRMFKSSLSKLNRTLSKYYPADLPPSTVRYLVPVCIFARTTSSICIWNVSALIMVHDFEEDFIAVGSIFAAAAFFDFLVSLMNLSGPKSGEVSQLSVNHFLACMAGLSLGSVIIALPNFYTFIVGFIIYAGSNSMLRIALIDLQGTSNNAIEGVMVQMIRRFQTAAALYCIPLLYKLHPRLPLVLALWFAILCLVLLFWMLKCCKKSEESAKVDEDVENRRTKSRSIKRRSSKPERNLIYSERAMLGRLITGKDV